MDEEMKEYTIFTVTDKNGAELEMAVVDEFEYDHKNYVVSALVTDDTIDEDSVYIYRAVLSEDDFTVEKITDPDLYQKLAEEYLKLEGDVK